MIDKRKRRGAFLLDILGRKVLPWDLLEPLEVRTCVHAWHDKYVFVACNEAAEIRIFVGLLAFPFASHHFNSSLGVVANVVEVGYLVALQIIHRETAHHATVS